jgi:BrnA antitoxin of type II toxin-antitoxin system
MRKQYDFSTGKRGAVLPSPDKTRITIMLDDDVLEFFRDQAEVAGIGYQTMINSTLREKLLPTKKKSADEKPITLATLRKTLREELKTGALKSVA